MPTSFECFFNTGGTCSDCLPGLNFNFVNTREGQPEELSGEKNMIMQVTPSGPTQTLGVFRSCYPLIHKLLDGRGCFLPRLTPCF